MDTGLLPQAFNSSCDGGCLPSAASLTRYAIGSSSFRRPGCPAISRHRARSARGTPARFSRYWISPRSVARSHRVATRGPGSRATAYPATPAWEWCQGPAPWWSAHRRSLWRRPMHRFKPIRVWIAASYCPKIGVRRACIIVSEKDLRAPCAGGALLPGEQRIPAVLLLQHQQPEPF